MRRFEDSRILTTAAAAVIALMPTSPSALEIGAGIGLGGSSVTADVGAGSGGISAGVGVSVGDTAAAGAGVGIGADVGISTGTTQSTTSPPGVVEIDPATGQPIPLISLVGMTIMSSDNVPLGRVLSAKRLGDGKLRLQIAVSDFLRTSRSKAILVIAEGPHRDGMIRIGMTAKAFSARV